MNWMRDEQSIADAAHDLAPELFDEFRRLARTLLPLQGRWGLCFLSFEQRQTQLAVANALRRLLPQLAQLDSSGCATWLDLERALIAAAANCQFLELPQLDDWLQGEHADARLRAWNIRREAYTGAVPVPLICWLRPARLSLLAETAVDLWSWRSGVFEFVQELEEAKPASIQAEHRPFDARPLPQKLERIHQIRHFLQGEGQNADASLRGNLLFELIDLHTRNGQYQEGLQVAQEELLPLLGGAEDERDRATAWSRIADIWQELGEWDKALQIREQEELPVYQKLGDERAIAISKSKIADIWLDQGQWEKALQVQEQERLPEFQKLADERGIAITKGKIADIWQSRGAWERALQIREQEELPIYQKLGDDRLLALTLGDISDIWQSQGEWEKALSILEKDVLPICQKLGNERDLALTKGRIANIWQSQGEWRKALQIYEQEALPVYQKLGDLYSILLTEWQIAVLLLQHAPPEQHPKAMALLQDAQQLAQKLNSPEQAKIAALLKRLLQKE